MSTYLPDSELSRFNASPAGEWFTVSPATAFVTERALHYHQLTDRSLDVTVGPLVELWDFGPNQNPPESVFKAPADEAVEETKAFTGSQNLEVRLDPPALRKSVEQLEVDLSAIAKGYAVDAVVELLERQGFSNFMVEIGGEVRAAGTRPDDKPWRIGVERPDLDKRDIYKVGKLENTSLATSGEYRNFRTVGEENVSHIIDPRTGRPLPYRGWSVTLLTDTCLEADALATALLVMGEQPGYDWCQKHNVAALFLIRQGNKIVEKATPKFLELTSSTPALER